MDIYYFTQERVEERDFLKYKKEIDRFNKLSDSELLIKYADLKSKYETKINILTLIAISVAMSLMTGLFGELFNLVYKTVKITLNNKNDERELVIIASIIIGITILFIIIIVFLSLVNYFNSIRKNQKLIIILDNILHKRKIYEK